MRHRLPQAGQIDPDVPIVPMLDMCFQLLAFFIMTFSPTPPEGHLDLALPKESGKDQLTPPPAFPLDEEDELTVQVEAAPEGGITGIKVLEKGAAEGKPLGADTAALFAYLRDRAARVGKVGKLRLEMGETLNYQYVVKLIDEATRAGYLKVSPSVLGGGK
jgi:biopolymer transport protein ExbD